MGADVFVERLGDVGQAAFAAILAVSCTQAAPNLACRLVAAATRGAAQGADVVEAEHSPAGKLTLMQEILAVFGTKHVPEALRLCRQGQRKDLATRIGRLSKVRNCVAHPDVTLVADILAWKLQTKGEPTVLEIVGDAEGAGRGSNGGEHKEDCQASAAAETEVKVELGIACSDDCVPSGWNGCNVAVGTDVPILASVESFNIDDDAEAEQMMQEQHNEGDELGGGAQQRQQQQPTELVESEVAAEFDDGEQPPPFAVGTWVTVLSGELAGVRGQVKTCGCDSSWIKVDGGGTRGNKKRFQQTCFANSCLQELSD